MKKVKLFQNPALYMYMLANDNVCQGGYIWTKCKDGSFAFPDLHPHFHDPRDISTIQDFCAKFASSSCGVQQM